MCVLAANHSSASQLPLLIIKPLTDSRLRLNFVKAVQLAH